MCLGAPWGLERRCRDSATQASPSSIVFTCPSEAGPGQPRLLASMGRGVQEAELQDQERLHCAPEWSPVD